MRFSIATKIFLAFTAMLLTSGAVLTFTVYQMRTLYDGVELINGGYVPLGLVLNDIKSDLRSYNVVLGEEDWQVMRKTLAASRSLYNFPEQIDIKLLRCENHIDRLLTANPEPRTQQILTTLQADLQATREVNLEFARRSDRFADVAAATDQGDAGARQLQADLQRMERRLETQIRAAQQTVRDAINTSLQQARSAENRTFGAVLGLSLVALILSATIMIVTHFTLRPLRRLTEGVKNLAEGDYSTIAPVHTRDEIGLLAREFNAMVLALAERDAALRDQAEALVKSERLAAIGELATKVTHELRNPLSTIRLNAELLDEDLQDHGVPDDDLDTLRSITSEVERLTALTEDYLRFARLPDPNPVPADLNQLVDAVVEFQRDELEWAGITLEMSLAPELPLVNVDDQQLRRALINLIRNAREAMLGEEDPHLIIETRLASDPAQVVVTVRDTGCGIPEEEARRIFEPFFSTKSQGTGLGLPLTLQILEEHGGTLTCASTPGEGTTFTMSFPVP